jgi:hypothetical protein
VITANINKGIFNETGNTFYSYQDNRIDGNGDSPADNIVGASLVSNALK